MAKFINLDELKNTNKTVQLNGKTYNIQPLSVGNFIKVTSSKQAIDKITDQDEYLKKTFETLVDLVSMGIPELTKEEIERMTPAQLTGLSNYIQESDEETQEAQEEIEKN